MLIQLPKPIIQPFDANNYLLAEIIFNFNIKTMGKLPKTHGPAKFYIESQLRVKYDQTIYM